MKSIIKRHFTKNLQKGKSVFELFNWIKRDIKLYNQKTGEVIFELKNAEFPDFYSENACSIIASKYFYRAVPETSLKQVVDRMCWFWIEALKDEGLIKTKAEASILYDELAYSMVNQMWAPNSPQWFNTGLKKYGIEADSDYMYYYDPEKEDVVLAKDRYTRSQTSACFIIPIKDELLGRESISDHYAIETKLFKGGSGVGTNFSNIRAEGEHLSSGGKSSGVMSFLLGLDRNAGAIKSGGTTRRAAKMVILDSSHPEIESFIDWKAKEEDKVKALGAAGYDTSINGEAYKTVSGQNSNNTVRVDKEFMNKKDDPNAIYKLKGITDSCVNKTVKAHDLWKKINQAAWKCADPGLQFSNTINAWNTCINDGLIRASNPCSEFVFLDNTACNLASINLLKFHNKENLFDIDSYTHLIGLIQLVLEASIHWGQFPTETVAENSYLYRPTGLGLTNYASLFLSLGIAYDSDEARMLAAALTGIMTGYSYYISSLMAKEIGPFERYKENSNCMLDVIWNHAVAARAVQGDFIDNGYLDIKPEKINIYHPSAKRYINIIESLLDVWQKALESGKKYGYRNAQVSCLAPTGTISFAMDCGATSIEPFFSHKIYKKCSDGSTMEITNPLAEKYINRTIWDEIMLKSVQDSFEKYGTYQKCLTFLNSDDKAVLATANEISPEAHIKMVAAVAPLVSGAVSKTINLPNSATVEDIMAINDLAYKSGVKAITVYRDGCKFSQPLNTKKKDNKALEKPARTKPTRIKPSSIRNSRTHAVTLDTLNLYITVSYYDNGDLAEIFISTDKEGTTIKGLLSALSKAISYMLQFGINPKEISQMLRGDKFEPAGLVTKHPNIKFVDSIADLISKIIDIECGNYNFVQVKDEQKKAPNPAEPAETEEPIKLYGETCPNCGSSNLFKTGVCKTCNDCGTTTGCG